jgi:glycosyltransferase involved in cell wall biosynthesis
MKILFFVRLFYPHIGGVEMHVEKISQILLSQGHSVTVITETPDMVGIYKPLETYKGIVVYRMPYFAEGKQKKFHIWHWLMQHKRLVENADVVHAHDVFFWYLPFKIRYPKKKAFVTFHGYETKFPVSNSAITVRNLSEKLSNGNICVGDYISKWYGTNPTYVSYGGIDALGKVKETKKNTANKITNITFFGRLEVDNGLNCYLDALEQLKEKKLLFAFIAVGDGALQVDAKKYGAVTGFVTDYKKYIESADIVFASSYLSIMEALFYKKTVIAVATNPLKKDYLQLAPFAKWIYIAETKEQIVDVVINSKNNDKQKNEAYQWVKKQTWEEVVMLYIKLWK